MPLKAWASANGFTAVHPEVRINKNGLAFLTFLKPDGKGGSIGENVYFSIPASEIALAKKVISQEDRATMLVCDTYNKQGELRMKLAFAGSNGYEAI